MTQARRLLDQLNETEPGSPDVLQARIKATKLHEYYNKVQDVAWDLGCALTQMANATWNDEEPMQTFGLVNGELVRQKQYDAERDRIELLREVDNLWDILLAIRSIVGDT
jgi:hypothetical protein